MTNRSFVTKKKDVVFSGMQPTGVLHLGNYAGSLATWCALQDMFEPIFCVVDLHAATQDYKSDELRRMSIATCASYIASGIDPDKSTIFLQSYVGAHAELMWILSCILPLGHLNRMTQFKDKSKRGEESSCLGLYAYPVLMAADILLYKTTVVPVGEDQIQHLELARDIARIFNNKFSREFFIEPKPMLSETSARVMSLRDGTKKMSKSDESDLSRINLDDDPDTITKKIAKAKTDSILGFEFESLKDRPEIRNLVSIFSFCSGESPEQICLRANLGNYDTNKFKKELTEVLINTVEPIRQKKLQLMADPSYLIKIVSTGNERAETIASNTLKEVKKLAGFYDLEYFKEVAEGIEVIN